MLAVRNLWHLAVLVAEDLDRGIALADGALVERSLDAVADGGEALEIGCGVKGGGVRRRVKDGTILKSTFFCALVPRKGTFVMRKIHERSAGTPPGKPQWMLRLRWHPRLSK